MALCELIGVLEEQFDREVEKHGQCEGFTEGEFEDYVNNMELYDLLTRLMNIERNLDPMEN